MSQSTRSLNVRNLLRDALPIGIFFLLLIGLLQLPLPKESYADSLHQHSSESICSRGDILICEDWETTSTLSPYNLLSGWEWNTSWNPLTRGGTVCGNLGYDSNCSLRLAFALNADDAVFPGHTFPTQPTTGVVYARWYIKYSPGYQWNAPGSKVAYLRSDCNGAFSWAAQLGSIPESSSNLTGPGKFYMDLQTHVVRLQYNKGTAANGRIVQGNWYAVEMMAKGNTAAGVANGAIKLWINGVLVMDYSAVDLRTNAVCTTSNLNMFWISAYIGGPTDPHPAQEMWYDNVVVSTNFIGPIGAVASPLSAPSNLQVN